MREQILFIFKKKEQQNFYSFKVAGIFSFLSEGLIITNPFFAAFRVMLADYFIEFVKKKDWKHSFSNWNLFNLLDENDTIVCFYLVVCKDVESFMVSELLV